MLAKNSNLLTATLLLACSAGAQAKLGGDQSANGVANWMAGALPSAGNYLIINSGQYRGRLQDGDGNRVKGGSADVWFSALRYVRMTETRLLGADYGWQVVVPLVQQKLELGGVGRYWLMAQPSVTALSLGCGVHAVEP